jgi:hypothetical protein
VAWSTAAHELLRALHEEDKLPLSSAGDDSSKHRGHVLLHSSDKSVFKYMQAHQLLPGGKTYIVCIVHRPKDIQALWIV